MIPAPSFNLIMPLFSRIVSALASFVVSFGTAIEIESLFLEPHPVKPSPRTKTSSRVNNFFINVTSLIIPIVLSKKQKSRPTKDDLYNRVTTLIHIYVTICLLQVLSYSSTITCALRLPLLVVAAQ